MSVIQGNGYLRRNQQAVELQAKENLELRRYLLRELTEEDALQVEARLFFESEYSEHLQAVKDDLVDEYVYGELSLDERKRFETHFFSDPDCYEDFKVAEALKNYIATEQPLSLLAEEPDSPDEIVLPPSKNSFWAFLKERPLVFRLLLASVVFVLVGGLWLIINIVRRPGPSRPAQAQLPTPQGSDINPQQQRETDGINVQAGNKNPQDGQGQSVAQTNQEQRANGNKNASTGNERPSNREGANPPSRRQKPVFALLIPGGLVRAGGSVKKVTLSANASVVNFKLALIAEADNRIYQATLQTADGKSIKTWTNLKSAASKWGAVVSIRAPANLFDQQSYSMVLRVLNNSGNARDVNSYPFQIIK
jgi:hypothetical protein